MLALLAHELSFFWIGMLYACRSITLNLLEIPSGLLADGWGRRRCMIISFAAYIISFLLFAFAEHWLWFFPAMVLYGMGDSFRTGTHKAMIFEWLRRQGRQAERTRIYGITRSWSKFGSASSALLAAAFVLWTGDYRSIFLFAIIPYILNIINFLGYPKELDGQHLAEQQRVSVRSWVPRTIDTLRSILRVPALRRLTLESMSWEGVLQAIRDYLQPVLATVVLANTLPSGFLKNPQQVATVSEGQNPGVVISVALAYTALFLFSGWASRTAHRVVDACGSESLAAQRLWLINLGLYCGLFTFDLLGWAGMVAASLCLLIILQNIWRPILVSRFDQHGDPAYGATVLSIESQSQRLATFFVAPLVGWGIDQVARSGGPGQFWPIGVVGGLAALVVLFRNPATD